MDIKIILIKLIFLSNIYFNIYIIFLNIIYIIVYNNNIYFCLNILTF